MKKFFTALKYSYAFSVISVFVVAFGIFTFSKLSQSKKSIGSYAQETHTADIIFDGNSFSPQEVTVTEGSTIRWTNTSSSEYAQIASDPHPAHTDHPFLNVGLIDPNGGVTTLVVNQLGTFAYHDHLHAQATGSITVISAPTATNTQTPTHTPTATPLAATASHTQTPIPTQTRVTATTTPAEVMQESFEEQPETFLELTNESEITPPIDTLPEAMLQEEQKRSISFEVVVTIASLLTILIVGAVYYVYKNNISKEDLS